MTRWGRTKLLEQASEPVSKPEIRLGNDAGLVEAVLEPPEMGARRAPPCAKNLSGGHFETVPCCLSHQFVSGLSTGAGRRNRSRL